MTQRRLYLDCDGVLADFDSGAQAIIGLPPDDFIERFGMGKFWKKLATAPDFYARLPLMPDARELFDGVQHLDPVILTGLPRGNWAAAQKVRWAKEHFPGTKIITVMAVDKRNHCREGDVLVDDMAKHRALWEGAGGVFVEHRSARESLARLAELFPSVRCPVA